MKKMIKWMLVLTLILSLVAVGTIACGDDDEDTPTPAPAATTPAPAATTPAPAATTPAPAGDEELTIESSIGDLLDNPDTEALLRKCVGDELIDNPAFSAAFGMDLVTVAPMSQGRITDETVQCVKDGLAALAAGGAPAATIDPSKSTYKIGAILSTTGRGSALGIPEENTAKMMADQVNAAGGINGHKLEVVIYDDATDSEKALTLTTRLIEQDKVLAILGPTVTGSSLAIINTVNQAKIPNVSCAASIDIVTPVADRYWVFKTPQTEREVVAEIYYYLQQKGMTKVALLTDTTAFGAGGKKYLESEASKYGITIVDNQTFNAADTSTESQLIHIKGTSAQAVVNWSTDKEGAMVARDMKTLKMSIPLFCSHGIANPAFIEQAGDAANGVIFPAGKLLVVDSVPASDSQKAVLDKYKADYEGKFGAGTINTFGGHMYDAFQMVTMALKKMPEGLSSQDARAFIRGELEKTTNFVGISGVFTMSSEDHLGMAPGSLAMIQIVDGDWTVAPAP
ncbi:MAG: ABC transporter substrate-binding protein [Dehalococcoidia bacterium]|nr:ABC transporter substrate-binding protein [Dehalococcoidia bacterium]